MCVDILIVGGGINGAGIARDAAGRGLKVALVEQSDLAAATSSASTKLIHGGLRYLEFFEFRLVREALIERERLLQIAPHLIRPMQFILPHVPGLRPRWQIRIGLFFYDHIGGRKRLPASHAVSLTGAPYSALRPDLKDGFAYADCWVDDARLVVLNTLDAAERGAAIHTRTRLVSAAVEGSHWVAHCETSDGRRLSLRARAIVNASGPWVDQVEQSLPIACDQVQVRLVKGSHITLPRLFEGEHAFMLQNPDGRIVFAIPYEDDSTLVGTTDVPFEGDPARVRISDQEIGYLCDTVNRYFRRVVTPGDVRWSYAGVRPLMDDESANASKVTRDYRLELTQSDQHPPVLSVYGGKITTYRRLAEAALARLQAPLGIAQGTWTGGTALPGGDLPGADFERFLDTVRRRWPFLSAPLSRRLARAYGTRMDSILGNASTMSDLGHHYGAELTQAELDYLIRTEWVRSAEDLLWRRSKLGLYLSAAQCQRLEQAIHTQLHHPSSRQPATVR